jgi:hypothetical protein
MMVLVMVMMKLWAIRRIGIRGRIRGRIRIRCAEPKVPPLV